MDRCDLCADRLRQGLRPACVEKCAAGTRIFDRLDAPEGEFAACLEKAWQEQGESRSSAMIFFPESEKESSL